MNPFYYKSRPPSPSAKPTIKRLLTPKTDPNQIQESSTLYNIRGDDNSNVVELLVGADSVECRWEKLGMRGYGSDKSDCESEWLLSLEGGVLRTEKLSLKALSAVEKCFPAISTVAELNKYL